MQCPPGMPGKIISMTVKSTHFSCARGGKLHPHLLHHFTVNTAIYHLKLQGATSSELHDIVWLPVPRIM
jgi:hypothetical protein